MYVCMYVCMYVYIYIYILSQARPPFIGMFREPLLGTLSSYSCFFHCFRDL